MAGILHTKVHLYACGNFGTVTNLRTYENSMCTSHAETVKVNLQLIGADDFGLNLKRICAPSSSNSANCKCAQIVVDFVRPNSPAYNCGQIQVGDRLLSINGHSTSTLSIDEILDIFDSSSSSLDLLIEFDVYETCSVLEEIVAVRLLKHSNQFGIEFQSGNGRKEDPIVVKSVQIASVAHRSGAIQSGDEFLTIDDIPMSGCSVDEANRLLQTCQNSIKIHLKKRGSSSDKKAIVDEECVFNYSVELCPINEPLGLVIDENMRVIGMQKNGLCWRTGSISINDKIVSIDGTPVTQSQADLQRFLDNKTNGTLLLGMCRRLQLAPRNSTQISYRPSTPSHNRLNLIDIQKVIGVMATTIQNKELQALRAFEKVEDQLLIGRPQFQRNSISEDQLPKRIGQRLSSESFSSSGFGSALSQQSATETPSCSCSHSAGGNSFVTPNLYSPISLFDPHSKNVLLLRDSEQSGFGFSISESEEKGIFVNAVKPDGMAQLNGICPNDRILQVNHVSTLGMSCSQLLPLFDSDILELVLYNEEDLNTTFNL